MYIMVPHLEFKLIAWVLYFFLLFQALREQLSCVLLRVGKAWLPHERFFALNRLKKIFQT